MGIAQNNSATATDFNQYLKLGLGTLTRTWTYSNIAANAEVTLSGNGTQTISGGNVSRGIIYIDSGNSAMVIRRCTPKMVVLRNCSSSAVSGTCTIKIARTVQPYTSNVESFVSAGTSITAAQVNGIRFETVSDGWAPASNISLNNGATTSVTLNTCQDTQRDRTKYTIIGMSYFYCGHTKFVPYKIDVTGTYPVLGIRNISGSNITNRKPWVNVTYGRIYTNTSSSYRDRVNADGAVDKILPSTFTSSPSATSAQLTLNGRVRKIYLVTNLAGNSVVENITPTTSQLTSNSYSTYTAVGVIAGWTSGRADTFLTRVNASNYQITVYNHSSSKYSSASFTPSQPSSEEDDDADYQNCPSIYVGMYYI